MQFITDKKIDEIIASGILYTEEHPNDPRVVVTSSLQHFIAAAKSTEHDAAIFRRPAPAIISLREAFKATEPHIPRVSSSNWLPDMKIACEDGDPVTFKIKPVFAPIEQELQDMVNVYKHIANLSEPGCITKDNPPHVRLFSPYGGVHTHHFPTLLSVWFKPGTVWLPKRGMKQNAAEGDWFLLKNGFKHAAPAFGEHLNRLVVAVVPANEAN